MTKTITIDPVTRIEGHGKVTLKLDAQGKVSDALFCVKEFRGLEKFCEGTLAEHLPLITSRICGICPTPHHLASTKAIEDCFGVTIPPTAVKLRELLALGQLIESHMLSLAMLSLPDLMANDTAAGQRNIIGMYQTDKETVGKALELRAVGNALTHILGRRFGQPISARIGGMVLPLKEEERKELDQKIVAAGANVKWFSQKLRSLIENNAALVDTLGDIQTCYMSMTQNSHLAFYDGNVRVIDAQGKPLTAFAPNQYFEHVQEKIENWSYMKFPMLKSGERFRVGPLARINLIDQLPTPLANRELEWFRAHWSKPAHKSLCYHYARFIEVVYAFERAHELLNDPSITQTDVYQKPEIKAGVGVGIVEAPRGTLVHKYEFDADGKTIKLDLLVATQHNNFGLNDALKETASKLITEQNLNDQALNQLEMIVRAYDPCLSCATHCIGERSFKFELIDHQGALIREWS